jgi:hypothetical protein
MNKAIFLLLICSSCSLLNQKLQDDIQKVETDGKELVADSEKTINDAIEPNYSTGDVGPQ